MKAVLATFLPVHGCPNPAMKQAMLNAFGRPDPAHVAPRRPADLLLAVLALAMIGFALLRLGEARAGLTIETRLIGTSPATVFRPASGPDPTRPVVVIAHGFAGSQQLMQPFALTFARNGYVAVTFDFLGHGRNSLPLGGSITELHGATRALMEQTASVADQARALGNGRIVLLGHSMATDIVIRHAIEAPDVVATIAVSAFSQAVTASAPRNLLLIAGGWETYLAQAARQLVTQVSAPEAPRDGVTYGSFSAGSARRLAIAEGVEHVSVLYSAVSMAESQAWLDQAAGRAPAPSAVLNGDGKWISLLLAGLILLMKPLCALLPVVSAMPRGAGLGWRHLWPALLVPAVATPLLLRFLPTHFLPILVADYLAAHFAMLGLLTALWLWLVAPQSAPHPLAGISTGRLALAALLATLFAFGGLAASIDAYVTAFLPIPSRVTLILAMLVGTLSYFLASEWLTRGASAGRWGYLVSQLVFLLSLVLAIALDFKRLFFLAIIIPVIVPILLVFGLFSAWIYRRTGHPFVGAIVNAVAFAIAIGVTFPMLAG